jgi:hypothetical protein
MDNTWVKLVNTSTSDENAACKTYSLNQTTAKMLRVTGLSKADNVSDYSDSGSFNASLSYSIRLDITYMDNSTEKYTHISVSSGTHDWESKEFFFYPKKAIKTAKVIVMLYWRTGTVWFKDITLHEQTATGAFATFDDTGILNSTTGDGYLVREFADGEDWYEIANGGSGDNWSLTASSTQTNDMTVHTATLVNSSGAERAGVLAYRIPLITTGLKWSEEDLRTETSASSLFTEYCNEVVPNYRAGNGKSRSKFLWGCVSNATVGYAIAIDPNYPVQFRIRYESNTKELFVVFDLGFDSTVTQATVKFVTWSFTPASGTTAMRLVIRDFYRLYPGAFKDRIIQEGEEHGNWFIKDLSGYTIPNPQDFGLKFQQGQTATSSMAYDEANDIFDNLYVHPTELFINISDILPNPTYSQVITKLNQLASESDPTAMAIQNSGVKDQNGQYIYHTSSPYNPDVARFVVNAAPGIGSPGRNAFYDQWIDSAVQDYLNPGTADGIMCDNAEAQYWYECDENTKIDYASSHFGEMETPLVHDKNGKVGICYEMMMWEYFNEVREDILPTTPTNSYDNKLIVMQANGVPYSTTFIAPKLDILGSEHTWDYPTSPGWAPLGEADMLRFRMQAGRKLVTFLQNTYDISSWTNSKTEKYFARCCAFGIMPSFYAGVGPGTDKYFSYHDGSQYYYERDRTLFQKYVPIIRKLSQAGWESVREVTVNDNDVFIERFGAEYITVFNPTTSSKTVTVSYLPASISINGKELISGNSVTWTNGSTSVTLGTEEVAVFEIPSLFNFCFEEGTGTSTTAESPYSSITGTISTTGATWTSGGIDGDAIDFDGTSGYVSIADNNIFDMEDSGLTYAAWVKADVLNSSSHNMILCKGSNQYLSIHDNLYFKIITDSTQQRYCVGSAQFQTDTWYHVAATYDREGYMKVFVNGRQDGNTIGPFLNPANNTSDIKIGYVSSGAFNGVIDDVRILRKGCNDKEIRRLKDSAILAYSFPLNDGTGTTVKDDFDSSRQATIYGATWHGNTSFDKKDNALYFDGIDDYVTITGSNSFMTDGANGFTFAAWIKPETLSSGHNIVVSITGTQYLSINNGLLLFKTITTPDDQRYCSGTTTLQAGNWYHVAGVFDADGYMKVYLNGELENTVGPYANSTNIIANIRLGTFGSGTYFNGIIEKVRIYNRGLTGDEISLLYENNE